MDNNFYKLAKDFVSMFSVLEIKNPTILTDSSKKYEIEYYESWLLSGLDTSSNYLVTDSKYPRMSIIQRIKNWWFNSKKQLNPCRVSNSCGKIQCFRDGIDNKSKEYILFVLFWCYFKYNNGKIIDDKLADELALAKLLEEPNIKTRRFLKEYISLIMYREGAPSKYSIDRVTNFINKVHGKDK